MAFVNLLDIIYPVGSIYMSTYATSPASIVGGQWEQVQGRFLLGSSNDYPVLSTGGEEEHKITLNEMPSHSHPYTSDKKYTNAYLGGTAYRIAWANKRDDDPTTNATTGLRGGSEPHNNMPPYLVVNIWRRVS